MGSLQFRSLRGIGFALVIGLTTCERCEPTLDQIVQRNAIAVGGKVAIERVSSIKIDLHVIAPDYEVDGTYWAARPGRMRIDIFSKGQRVFTEAFDGARAWQWKGEGDSVDESDTATAALRHGVELPGHLFGLHELRGRGHRLELTGQEIIDGSNYYALRVTLSDGYETTLYLDAKSWLITRRREVRPLHPDRDPTPATIETRMSDFRKVNGLYFPFASMDMDLNTSQVLERTVVRSIQLNPVIDADLFTK